MQNGYYTIPQIANILRRDRGTIWHHVCKGKLPATRSGKRWYISFENIVTYLHNNPSMLYDELDIHGDWARCIEPLRDAVLREYISANELAALLGYDRSYFNSWPKRHGSPKARDCGRKAFYNRSEFAAWLKQHRPADFTRIKDRLLVHN